jgi:hypothetical protein
MEQPQFQGDQEMDSNTIAAIPTSERGELRLVASLIRPLPQDVAPSDEFLRRMRGRLLRLTASAASRERAA